MPLWNDVVEGVVIELDNAIKAYETNKRAEEYNLTLNLSNIIAISGRFSDLYGLGVIAFNEDVGWFGSSRDSSSKAAGVSSGETLVLILLFILV